MFDHLTSFEDGLIHHGDNNKRIYVMKLPSENVPRFLDRIEIMAGESGYEKIIAKVPAGLADLFEQRDYEQEASIPGYFSGKTDCLFMSRFLFEHRQGIDNQAILDDVLETAHGCISTPPAEGSRTDLTCRRAAAKDADDMAKLYRKVFASYPFPIHEPGYIRETMEYNVIYHGIWQDGQLIALASAELDRLNKNAEMTDFAVLPECRGSNLGGLLLSELEKELQASEDIATLYTIARAASHGMNCTFAKMNYRYGGRLINNTQIAGQIESMNIWYKNAEDKL